MVKEINVLDKFPPTEFKWMGENCHHFGYIKGDHGTYVVYLTYALGLNHENMITLVIPALNLMVREVVKAYKCADPQFQNLVVRNMQLKLIQKVEELPYA